MIEEDCLRLHDAEFSTFAVGTLLLAEMRR